MGYGGVTAVSRACGLSRVTITRALRELDGPPLSPGRVRRPRAGRKSLVALDPGLLGRLDGLLDPLSRGEPDSPLRWTVKGTRTLSAELSSRGHSISYTKVAQLLRQMRFSLQVNIKAEEGEDQPDRDAQFRHVNGVVRRALAVGSPVLSVGAQKEEEKEEEPGKRASEGRQRRDAGTPRREDTSDLAEATLPRACRYGIYGLGRRKGLVNLGTDRDAGAFAVASIRGWWRFEGRKLYPGAKELLITADGGGSAADRRRPWKLELQGLADEIGIPIRVSHFPSGTSKWNERVEHRLFSFVSSSWRGEPPCDRETVVRLIAVATTAKGLPVTCRLDRRRYAAGRQVTDGQMASVELEPEGPHGEWNYTIRPVPKR